MYKGGLEARLVLRWTRGEAHLKVDLRWGLIGCIEVDLRIGWSLMGVCGADPAAVSVLQEDFNRISRGWSLQE